MRFSSHFWLFQIKKRKFFFIIVFFSLIQVFLEMIICSCNTFVTFLLKPESLNEISFLSNLKILENITIDEQTILIICLIFFSIF